MPVGIYTSRILVWAIEHGRKQLQKVGGGSPGLRFGRDQPINNPRSVSIGHIANDLVPYFIFNVDERPRCWNGTEL